MANMVALDAYGKACFTLTVMPPLCAEGAVFLVEHREHGDRERFHVCANPAAGHLNEDPGFVFCKGMRIELLELPQPLRGEVGIITGRFGQLGKSHVGLPF